ncbi:MAG: PEP/pyruvate-binding domain-containing protein [Kofleriaceae bacterium]|nr:PEP/pyruvate-binding domain-containing protein [Kofleriaceae bacterium]
MWVHDLGDADAACGGKALGLARLVRAQLPVPRGFAIDERAFRHVAGELTVGDRGEIGQVLAAAMERIRSATLPEDFVREVDRRAAELGALVVRSSATIEDGEAGAAAGVFSSSGKVAPAEVWDAIRAVWASALTPLAAAYAQRRGGRISIGVIVQAFAPGERVTIYTRPPGAPASEDLLLQRGTALTRLRPASAGRAQHAGPVEPKSVRASFEPVSEQGAAISSRETQPLVELALRAEAAIGATQGADVELVVGDHILEIVQARAIVHPVATKRSPVPSPVLAGLVADGRTWTWDVTHNPDPLSTAQAELVRLVDEAGIGPAMRVCAGYLYTAARDAAPPRPATDNVPARVADIEARLAAILDGEHALPEALERYIAAIRIWAHELSPLVRALPKAAGHRPSAVEATLAAAARGALTEAEVLARIGVLSPAWDVAVPTYAERPELVREAISRARSLSIPTRAEADRGIDLAADLAERDDVWFAKAQWLVRRALLARADELGVARADVCWLPFATLEHRIAPDDAHRQASGARAANERAARWDMPRVVPTETQPRRSTTLHGVGTGPRVSGRVVRFATLGSAITVHRGDVVVARAVTPALAVLVIGCAALVSETGGLLDHGAALARELGVPCVVGCHNAWSLLADGMLVTVDGDRGSVEIAETTSEG